MKLSLLVLTVAVAAVLVPSLSEGRVVSKCELKNKLWNRIIVPRKFGTANKEHVLAVVICELTRMSLLNTSMVQIEGERPSTSTTTTTVPMMEETTLSTPWADEMEKEATTEETSIEETTTEEPFAEELSAEETPTEEAPTEEAPTEEAPTEETITEEAPTEETPTEETTTEESSAEELSAEEAPTEDAPTEEPSAEEVSAEDVEQTEATTTEATTSKTTTTEPVKTKLKAGKNRPKHMVDIFSEELIWTEFEFKMEELVNQLSSNCNEMEIEEVEYKTDDEDSDSNAVGDENNYKLWSLGRYGVFQLSDGYYCNSGYRRSKNKCKKSCSAFTDDDITDDIECFMKIGCWKKIFQARSLQCSRVRNYFDEC